MTTTEPREGADPGQMLRLGLPVVSEGPVLAAAREMGAPLLVSANALSVRVQRDGWKEWTGFRTSNLGVLDGLDVALDSAGFVAMTRYRGYDWSVEDYMDLCAAFPWTWWAILDYCCEPEIAADREEVFDRISQTVASTIECRRAAQRRGLDGSMLGVVQGWFPQDYARCLDRLPFDYDATPMLGVGSVCRRRVGGANGVVAIVDRIDKELGSAPTRLHLFGIKGDAAEILRDHPRVASFDSQAYGSSARWRALRGGFSKSNAFLAEVARGWYGRHADILAQPPGKMPAVTVPFDFDFSRDGEIERRVAVAHEQMRVLVEQGEMDAIQVTDRAVWEWAFMDDDEEGEG